MARQLFADRGFDAVTIAKIAAAASVSVQTVFNHFATKEDLFFDGRTDWVDGPAEAVRRRQPPVSPLTALRDHLVHAVQDIVYREALPEGQRYIAALAASPTLGTRERELVHEAELRLHQALTEAWSGGSPETWPASLSLSNAAAVTAATWLATARAVITTQRPLRGNAEQRAADVASRTAQVLLSLQAVASDPHDQRASGGSKEPAQ